MKETFSAEQPPKPEGLNLELVTVSSGNIQDLENVRRVVDGEKNIVPEKFASELKRYESGGDHSAFLVRDGENVVGYIEVDVKDNYTPKGADSELCKELNGYAHVARIGLLPEYRGQKIGNTLLDYAEAWVGARGAVAIWLDYISDKEQLVKFYEGAGYQTFTEFKDGDKDRFRRIAVKHLK